MPRRLSTTRRARGFSLIELLVVIAIILVLIGIAAPAYFAIRSGASEVATESTLQSIATAIEQFENDHGYLPPLILDDPAVDPMSPDWATSLSSRTDAAEALRRERYHSIYALSVYLGGVGELSPDPDSVDPDRHDGLAGAGFRDPGPDRAWGGAARRTVDTHRVASAGQTFGPYLDVQEGDLMRNATPSGSIDGLPIADFPEDPAPPSAGDTPPWERMFVFTDSYGNAIRYYRYWPTRVTGEANRSLLDAPAEIVDPRALRSAGADAMSFDAALDPELERGRYVLLSAGPDGLFTPPAGLLETGDAFAAQGSDPEGWVSDFLELDPGDRQTALDGALEDNLRVVR